MKEFLSENSIFKNYNYIIMTEFVVLLHFISLISLIIVL